MTHDPAHKIGCTGKSAFSTFARADFRAKRLRQNRDTAHVEAYHCRHCHQFHIGEARSYGRQNPKKQDR